LVRCGLVVSEPGREDGAQLTAGRHGVAGQVGGVCVIERVEPAWDDRIESAVAVLAHEVLGNALGAARTGRQHQRDSVARPPG
jgi:hypothetical protein